MSNRLLFLGTGSVGGVPGKGKTKRLETSTLIKTSKVNILIDVSEDFSKQSKLINRIDAVLITHGHRDAIGGISQLRSQKSKIIGQNLSLYSLSKTIQIIKRKFRHTEFLDFHSLKSFKSFKFFNIKIIPFEVRHSIQKGFPTLGFKFYFPDGYKLIYISDTGGWNNKVQNLIVGSDLLILDGAMWGKKLIAHLDMEEITSKAKNWGIKKLIFTQIGKTAPPYEILKKELRKIWDEALPAYDGLEILLKK
jgi:phosphoribosyl 1,2-cyclic phosphodiesterase